MRCGNVCYSIVSHSTVYANTINSKLIFKNCQHNRLHEIETQPHLSIRLGIESVDVVDVDIQQIRCWTYITTPFTLTIGQIEQLNNEERERKRKKRMRTRLYINLNGLHQQHYKHLCMIIYQSIQSLCVYVFFSRS